MSQAEYKFKRVFDVNQQAKLRESLLYKDHILDDVRTGKIFPAFRNNTVNFYHKGGKAFHFKDGTFSTHCKYASVLHGHDRSYINETELKEAKLITDFKAGYSRIKENCSLYSGVEAAGVSKLFSKSSYALQNPNIVVLDIEVSLKALDDVEADTQEKPRTQDRIDLLLYNKETKTLQFFEVKHFSNSEIWSKAGTKPVVVKQVEKYNGQLLQKHDDILAAYIEYTKTARILFELLEDQLPDPVHLNNEVILLVFGFDSYQLNRIDELLIRDKSLKDISRRFLGNLDTASKVWKESTIIKAGKTK